VWACLRNIPPLITALSEPEPTNGAPLSLVSIHGAIPGGCTNYMKWSLIVLVTAFTAHCFFVIINMVLTTFAVTVRYCTFTYDVLTFPHTSSIIHSSSGIDQYLVTSPASQRHTLQDGTGSEGYHIINSHVTLITNDLSNFFRKYHVWIFRTRLKFRLQHGYAYVCYTSTFCQ